MALSTYGPALDLHAGGADLRFPHHAYESAQAEAATGVDAVRPQLDARRHRAASTARRWPSRPATWSSSPTSSSAPAAPVVRTLLLDRA